MKNIKKENIIKENEIVLFNDFFSTCYVNSIMSFISKYSTEYKKAAYVNGYSYYEQPFQRDMIPFLQPLSKQKFLDNLYEVVDVNYYCFKDQANIIPELIELSKDRKNIILNANFDYWAAEIGIAYGVNLTHSIPIVKYNQEKDTFTVFDIDNYHKFHFMDKPSEVIAKAFYMLEKNTLAKQEFDYIIVSPKQNPKSFKISIEEVISNSKQLYEELNLIKDLTYDADVILEKVKEKEGLFILNCSTYANSQKANNLLFLELYNEGFINVEQLQHLKKYTQVLQEKSKINMSLILKCKMTQKWEKFNNVLASWQDIYSLEINKWQDFLEMITN